MHEVAMPEFAGGVIFELPGLAVKVGVVDQACLAGVTVERVPVGGKGGDGYGMARQETGRHLTELRVRVVALFDAGEDGGEIESAEAAVNDHDAEGPTAGADFGVGFGHRGEPGAIGKGE